MKTKTITIIIGLLISLPLTSHSAFLDFGWGARPAGMGGAFTAVADDANAPLWNPAGIGRVGTRKIMFMHAIPYMGMENVGIGLEYASFILPLKENIFGLSWTNFTSANQYSENAFNLTYSRIISENFFIGGNLKLMGQNYEASFDDPVFDSGTGKYSFDTDVGILFCLPNKFCVGGVIKNILETDIGLYDVDKLNRDIRVGIAYYLIDDLVFAIDVDYKNVTLLEVFGGAEMWFMNRKLGVRAGTNYRNNDIHEITVGATYRQFLGEKRSVTVDYCCVLPLTIIGNNLSHRLALTLGF